MNGYCAIFSRRIIGSIQLTGSNNPAQLGQQSVQLVYRGIGHE